MIIARASCPPLTARRHGRAALRTSRGCPAALRRPQPRSGSSSRPLGANISSALKRFESSRTLKLPVRNENRVFTLNDYLQEVERIVHVTFPDERRREKLDAGKWRVTLLPYQFFWITFKAVNTVEAWAEPDCLKIKVKDLVLEGVPPELDLNKKLNFNLDGDLKIIRPKSASSGLPVRLAGKVSMQLSADVPDAFFFAPGLEQVSQSLMDTILGNLERALIQNLVQDYQAWTKTKRTALT